VAVAERLPDPLGTELLATARQAFTQCFQLTAAICVAVMIATAIVATILLRRDEVPPETKDSERVDLANPRST